MTDRRPIRNRHASLETDISVETHRKLIFFILFAYLSWNYVRDSKKKCRSLKGLQLGIQVSDVSPIRHVYKSLIRHVGLRPSISVPDWSPIRHVVVRWGMSISDGSPIRHVEVSDGSPIRYVGLRWVSDNNNTVVNSSVI